jgi:hypothetical protein
MAKSVDDRGGRPKAVALNIRNFPQDLVWRCRERAAQKRMTLREFVIEALRTATSESSK